jgi:hypothetical protein
MQQQTLPRRINTTNVKLLERGFVCSSSGSQRQRRSSCTAKGGVGSICDCKLSCVQGLACARQCLTCYEDAMGMRWQ